jgi:uncharacterized protein
MRCFFASDLHGHRRRYQALFTAIAAAPPEIVLLGGDLLPNAFHELADGGGEPAFITGFLREGLLRLRSLLGPRYPAILYILGNDDTRAEEPACAELEAIGLWRCIHNRREQVGSCTVYGYSYVPPTPFLLKDWERYDVSRYVDPGCVSPEEGWRTVPVDPEELRGATIQADLQALAGSVDLGRSVWLFHAPPHQTHLDRAALDGVSVDHAPLDVHVGSVAVRRFLETRQPMLSLHGHVHESARLTGSWRDQLGATRAFSAAHDGPELALVVFELERLDAAERQLR